MSWLQEGPRTQQQRSGLRGYISCLLVTLLLIGGWLFAGWGIWLIWEAI